MCVVYAVIGALLVLGNEPFAEPPKASKKGKGKKKK